MEHHPLATAAAALTAAIIGSRDTQNPPDVAKRYFEYLDALVVENEKRMADKTKPFFRPTDGCMVIPKP